ncbi:MAG: SLBB domain-containing protein [Bacteriovorax sp.]
MFKKIILITCLFQVLNSSFAFAEEKASTNSFKDFALPSEFEGLRKEPGSFFYSPTSKGKVLIPINVWGEVNKAGLHYVPLDTNIVQGLSLAGGPKSTAALDSVRLTKNVNGKIEEFKFDLMKGGKPEIYNIKLEPGDTLFVEKEYYFENRAYITGLVAVGATILSSILLYRQIRTGH